MNEHTSKLFKNVFYDVQTEDKGQINTAFIPNLHFDTISFKELKIS